jgi:two-component system, NtrC family, sensor histidine kinase HydH
MKLRLARRYLRRLLAELLAPGERLSDSEASPRVPGACKLDFTSQAFRRLAQTRCRLQANERKWQLERRKLNGEKLTTVATLAAGFAHEIGTPLGVIRGLAEMLLSTTIEQSEVKENLEIIIIQADQISRMVKTLLDIGQCRSMIRVTSDIRAIAERSIRLIKPEAARRGVEVFANLGSRPLMVDCDPDRLQEVFVNLETNALDAMVPSGGKLRVNSTADEVHGRVRLSFEDTGPGVPTMIRDRIFDPFFTTKGTGQGHGAGLAVSQSVIGEHDGELTLEPQTSGACFIVTLPASRAYGVAPPT